MIAEKPTVRIPIEKKGNLYSMTFTGTILNRVQTLLLKGAESSDLILEFTVEEKPEDE